MILTTVEKQFLDVFLYEATTPPFTGPATDSLHQIGVEYGDITHIAWAYEQDVPRTDFAIGHPASIAPPLPWPDRQSVLERDHEIQRLSEQRREMAGVTSNLR